MTYADIYPAKGAALEQSHADVLDRSKSLEVQLKSAQDAHVDAKKTRTKAEDDFANDLQEMTKMYQIQIAGIHDELDATKAAHASLETNYTALKTQLESGSIEQQNKLAAAQSVVDELTKKFDSQIAQQSQAADVFDEQAAKLDEANETIEALRKTVKTLDAANKMATEGGEDEGTGTNGEVKSLSSHVSKPIEV